MRVQVARKPREKLRETRMTPGVRHVIMLSISPDGQIHTWQCYMMLHGVNVAQCIDTGKHRPRKAGWEQGSLDRHGCMVHCLPLQPRHTSSPDAGMMMMKPCGGVEARLAGRVGWQQFTQEAIAATCTCPCGVAAGLARSGLLEWLRANGGVSCGCRCCIPGGC